MKQRKSRWRKARKAGEDLPPNKYIAEQLVRRGNVCMQKYSRLRCLLRVKGLVICFYLRWSGSTLQFRQNIIKVGSKSWLLTCSSSITLSLPSYTDSAMKRELIFVTTILVYCIFGTLDRYITLPLLRNMKIDSSS